MNSPRRRWTPTGDDFGNGRRVPNAEKLCPTLHQYAPHRSQRASHEALPTILFPRSRPRLCQVYLGSCVALPWHGEPRRCDLEKDDVCRGDGLYIAPTTEMNPCLCPSASPEMFPVEKIVRSSSSWLDVPVASFTFVSRTYAADDPEGFVSAWLVRLDRLRFTPGAIHLGENNQSSPAAISCRHLGYLATRC